MLFYVVSPMNVCEINETYIVPSDHTHCARHYLMTIIFPPLLQLI
jgi:hypothetical protein